MTVLDIAVFATADAAWQDKIDYYIAGAAYHFANFSIFLNISPIRPFPPVALSRTGAVHDRPPDFGDALLPGDVRSDAHAALPDGHGIPVIFCRFHRSDAGLTVFTADRGANRGVAWLNYILVNADRLNQSGAVLAHELIHAAGYVGDIDPLWDLNRHDSDPTSIMHPAVGPGVVPQMQERHANALRSCYFARN